MIKTKVINFVAGAGAGKSLMSALTFAELKLNGIKCEYIQEYAKTLVWQNRLDELDNQYQVSLEQYKMIKPLHGVVDYIICDSGMILGVFYNRFHKTNVCNIEKTEEMIKSRMSEFDNIYIFLERDPNVEYEQAGRLQTEEEAKMIDTSFINIMNELGLKYKSFTTGKQSIPLIIDYIRAVS